MTDPNPDAPLTPDTPDDAAQGDPADKPLGEGGERALKAEREARAAAEKSAAALQKKLDDIEAANLSDLERAQKEAAEAKALVEQAKAETLRFRVAAEHGISTEDAALFLTGSDAETLQKQAARLAERTSTTPKPDLSQGGKSGTTTSTPEKDFASFLQGQLS